MRIELANLEADGFCVLEDFLSLTSVENLAAEFERLRAATNGGHSLRNVHESPLVREISLGNPCFELAKSIVGDDARLVRAIFFDKIPGANWSVPWHQDLTIAVADRVEVEGYKPWSRKEGVWHVQPPAHVLEQMLTIRVHLDDCGIENGPVRVKAGSHRFGRIAESEMEDCEARKVACTGSAGSALIMRPLLLHASSPAQLPAHRRVLHMEYAGCELPRPLEWFLDSGFTG